jgi:hypothetical protein
MATRAAAVEGADGRATSFARPYPQSWLDTLVGWIDRLPGPTWVWYVPISVAAVAFVALEAALSSRGLFGQVPAYFGYAFFHVYALAAYHFLARGADSAVAAFRPATDADDATAERWQLELSTTPARPAAALWVLSGAGYIALLAAAPQGWDLAGHSAVFVALRVLSEGFWIVPIAWLATYLLFRQMRLVAELHRYVVRVDLLQPGPLHAMATLTARGALVVVVFQLAFVVAPLPNLSEGVRLAQAAFMVPFVGLSVAAFIVPLRGMQALLAAEKRRRLAVVNTRLDAALATLHGVVDEEAVPMREESAARLAQTRVDALNKAISSLLQEREFVMRQSTWPWDTGTFRAVASAVLLPVVLFLVTRALERFVF